MAAVTTASPKGGPSFSSTVGGNEVINFCWKAERCLEVKNYAGAQKALFQAVDASRLAEDYRRIRETLFEWFDASEKLGAKELLLEVLNKWEDHVQRTQTSGRFCYLIFLGKYYQATGDAEKAETALVEAEKWYDEEKLEDVSGRVLIPLIRAQGQDDRSRLFFLTQALEMTSQQTAHSLHETRARLFVQLGELHAKIGTSTPQKVEECFKKAEEEAMCMPVRPAAKVLIPVGDFYVSRNETQKALSFFRAVRQHLSDNKWLPPPSGAESAAIHAKNMSEDAELIKIVTAKIKAIQKPPSSWFG